MNKNLFTKELKRNRKNLIIWSSIVVGFTVMILAIFPFMAEMGEDMAMLMENMPVELSKAMGMDAQTWTSILGFYSTYYGIYIIVLISIYTASTGAGIISKEERDGTSEFLMTRPISRRDVFVTKMASLGILSIFIFSLQTLTAVICISIFKNSEIDWSILAKMQAGGLILMILFTSIGVLISMFLKPKKNFMGMIVGLTFGSYFLNAIAKSTDATAWLGYFSPYHYMDFTIDPNYSFNYLGAVMICVISALILVFSLLTFKKKDIVG